MANYATLTQAVEGMYNSAAATYNAANPSLPQMPAALWFGEAPETAPQIPMAIFEHRGEIPRKEAYPSHGNTNSTPVVVDGNWSIILYGPSIPVVEVWASVLKTTYLPVAIGIIGTSQSITKRQNYVLTMSPPRDATGSPIWQVKISWQTVISNPVD